VSNIADKVVVVIVAVSVLGAVVVAETQRRTAPIEIPEDPSSAGIILPSTGSIAPDPTEPLREGYALVIGDVDRYRYKLVINAMSFHCDPEPCARSMWDTPEWREMLRVANDTFPVKIWRYRPRFGEVVPIATLRMPATNWGFVNWPVPQQHYTGADGVAVTDPRGVMEGDQILIEQSPGIRKEPLQGAAAQSDGRAMPFYSLIDKASNDATTMPTVFRKFRPGPGQDILERFGHVRKAKD